MRFDQKIVASEIIENMSCITEKVKVKPYYRVDNSTPLAVEREQARYID